MESPVERFVNHTGQSLPLAAQMLDLIVASGASHIEIVAALNMISFVLPTLQTSLVPDRRED